MDIKYLKSLSGSPYVDESLWNRVKTRTKARLSPIPAVAKNILGGDLTNVELAKLNSLLKSFAKEARQLSANVLKTELKPDTKLTPKQKQSFQAFQDLVNAIDKVYKTPVKEGKFSDLVKKTGKGIWRTATVPHQMIPKIAGGNLDKILDGYKQELGKMYNEFLSNAQKITKLDAQGIKTTLGKNNKDWLNVVDNTEKLSGVKPTTSTTSGGTPPSTPPSIPPIGGTPSSPTTPTPSAKKPWPRVPPAPPSSTSTATTPVIPPTTSTTSPSSGGTPSGSPIPSPVPSSSPAPTPADLKKKTQVIPPVASPSSGGAPVPPTGGSTPPSGGSSGATPSSSGGSDPETDPKNWQKHKGMEPNLESLKSVIDAFAEEVLRNAKVYRTGAPKAGEDPGIRKWKNLIYKFHSMTRKYNNHFTIPITKTKDGVRISWRSDGWNNTLIVDKLNPLWKEIPLPTEFPKPKWVPGPLFSFYDYEVVEKGKDFDIEEKMYSTNRKFANDLFNEIRYGEEEEFSKIPDPKDRKEKRQEKQRKIDEQINNISRTFTNAAFYLAEKKNPNKEFRAYRNDPEWKDAFERQELRTVRNPDSPEDDVSPVIPPVVTPSKPIVPPPVPPVSEYKKYFT